MLRRWALLVLVPLAAGWDAPLTPDGKPLPAALVRLVDLLLAESELTSAKAAAAVERSGVTADDLKPWADFDHPVADSYGRKVRARICTLTHWSLVLVRSGRHASSPSDMRSLKPKILACAKRTCARPGR